MEKKILKDKYSSFEDDNEYSFEGVIVKKSSKGERFVYYKKDIGDFEVDHLISMLNTYDPSDFEIIIVIGQDVLEIVESFIAYMFLLCCNKRIRSIKIILPYKKIGFEFAQQYYISGLQNASFPGNLQIYTYKTIGDKIEKWSGDISGLLLSGRGKRFIVSRSFVPMIYVDDLSFEKFFLNKYEDLINIVDITSAFSSVKDDMTSATRKKQKSIYNSLYPVIIEKLKDNKEAFYCLYYFRILEYFGVSHKFYNLNSLSSGVNDNNLYLKKVSYALRRVLSFPLYYAVIFYVILINKKILLGNKLSGLLCGSISFQEVGCILQGIDEVLNQVETIYYGIYEIVKNIKEHSTHKRGVICGKVYDKSEVLSIKKNKSQVLGYVNGFEDDECYLVMSMIDDGDLGIITHARNSLQEISDINILDAVKKDIDIIDRQISEKNEGQVLNDLFYNIDDVFFERQKIKAAASYGLLIFVSMLNDLKGMFSVDTVSVKEGVRVGFIKTSQVIESFENNGFYNGTIYNIVLPLKHKPAVVCENIREFDDGLLMDKLLMGESDDAFAELSKFIVINNCEYMSAGIKKMPKNNRLLLCAEYNEIDIVKRYDKSILLAINLEDNSVDASDLLKSMANMQLSEKNAGRSLIIYGCKENLVRQFIRILKLWERVNKAFWSNNSIALFYYKKDYMIPCFVLCGNSYHEYVTINHELMNKHLIEIPDDTLSIGVGNDGEKVKRVFKHGNMLFTRNGELLHYDLLLSVGLGKTIFENNTCCILMKEIKDF